MTNLHEEDLAEWAYRNAALLRSGHISEADLQNIAEEIEALGTSQEHELSSRVVQILEHRLKLLLTTGPLLERNRRGWSASMARQQIEIQWLLKKSPSLKRLLNDETLRDCYAAAVRIFSAGYELNPPDRCPFTWLDIL